MATYAQIKSRIVAEMVRDDLNDTYADLLVTHIERACEYFSDERFWFNAIVASAETVAGVATVDVPATVRRVDRVSIPAYSLDLLEAQLAQIDDSSVQSIPAWYAYNNDSLQFQPIPDAAYALRIVGLRQIDAPTNDDDENEWTDEAQDLIVARVRFTLCRDLFRDPEGAQMALGAIKEALQRLKRETARRLETPLRSNRQRSAFNWRTGD